MQFQPYLTFDGNAAEAMKFYERLFGGKIEQMMTFGDMPPEAAAGMAEACPGAPQGPMPEEMKKRVLHTALLFDGGMLMASDSMPGQPYEGMKNVGIAVSFPTVERAREVVDALAEGGQVQMPFGETFWSEAFGAVVDRFGTNWLVNGGKRKM
ncbi:MAG: VOC family protein [Burkholderiaceae bacterium]|jgi:PhnB protein